MKRRNNFFYCAGINIGLIIRINRNKANKVALDTTRDAKESASASNDKPISKR